jgi:hypothetical protein
MIFKEKAFLIDLIDLIDLISKQIPIQEIPKILFFCFGYWSLVIGHFLGQLDQLEIRI